MNEIIIGKFKLPVWLVEHETSKNGHFCARSGGEASAQARKQLQGASAEHLKREWVFFFTQIGLCTLTLIKSLLLWILSACLNARNSGYAFKYRYSARARRGAARAHRRPN
jgi:hypothetical protein